MSTNDLGIESEDSETYGHAVAYDHGDGEFVRDTRGQIDTFAETEMVADELARALETPVGDDPWRPSFGLDREKFTENMILAREAIIEAIGPEADPRVSHIDRIDISQPAGERQHSRVTIRLTLTSGAPIEFRAAFESLVGVPGRRRGGGSIPAQTEPAGELLATSDYREGEVDRDRSDDELGEEEEEIPDVPPGEGGEEGEGEEPAPWENFVGRQLGTLGLPPEETDTEEQAPSGLDNRLDHTLDE